MFQCQCQLNNKKVFFFYFSIYLTNFGAAVVVVVVQNILPVNSRRKNMFYCILCMKEPTTATVKATVTVLILVFTMKILGKLSRLVASSLKSIDAIF